MRALVVKMSSLGDVVHTLPALTDAARSLPGICFDWVVEEAFAEIPAWHPAVATVIPVALRRWRRQPWKNLRGSEWQQAREALASERYDAVIDAQGLVKSAFIASRVAAPRYGMDRKSVRERLATAAYHHQIAVPKNMHAVERTRLLFARALNYQLPDARGDYGIRAGLHGSVQQRAPALLFFHGTARAEKLWPEAHWLDLLEQTAAAGYQAWLPWASDQEHERAQRIAQGCAAAEVLPRLSLQGLAERLLQVQAVVAVDTGLGHLSAALDVPTVSLYGPTSTHRVGAYGQNQVHIQSPVGVGATRDPAVMMASISAAAVWSELRAILARRE